jgi:hypothetical protein
MREQLRAGNLPCELFLSCVERMSNNIKDICSENIIGILIHW